MNQKFNIFELHEIPDIWLCNPNQSKLANLNVGYDIKVTMRFNDTSEISLTVPEHISYEGTYIKFEAYELLQAKRLIMIEELGVFVITSVVENDNGLERTKSVSGYSLENELNQKRINLFGGTYKFYDFANPSNSLLGQVFNNMPGWSIGHVDVDLLDIYRTFEISDSTVYQFIMNDIEKAFECVFTFDTFNRELNAYTLENATSDSDIYLSLDNLMQTIKIEELSDEIVTCLKVYGDAELNISGVNPLGTPSIYNFDYYKNTKWMSQDLIDAINSWEQKISNNTEAYKSNLLLLKNANETLLNSQLLLDNSKTNLQALEITKAARIDGGLTSGESWETLTKEIEFALSEVFEFQNRVDDNLQSINNIRELLIDINNTLAIGSNFTTEQLKELDPFIIENTYQNSAFIQTEEMTQSEIQDMQQELFDTGTLILDRVASPRYSFDVDSVNFMFLKEFEMFTSQLNLGCKIHVQSSDSQVVYPILLEISFSYDNPDDFKLVFGNRYKLDTGDYQFSDLFDEALKGGTNSSFNQELWNTFVNNGYETKVNDLLTEAWNSAKNAVINADNQQIIIDGSGLHGKQLINGDESDNPYKPNQIWITGSTIAMTDDYWETVKLAIGEISVGGSNYYGVAAEAIVGNLIVGSQLFLDATNDTKNQTLKFDSDGLSITSSNNNNTGTVKINGTDGIAIFDGSTKKLWMDTQGNLQIAGNLSAATGTFSGNLSAAGGTFTGTLNGVDGNFTGTVTANSGQIGDWNIRNGDLSNSTNDVYLTPIPQTFSNGNTGAYMKVKNFYVGDRGIWYGDPDVDASTWRITQQGTGGNSGLNIFSTGDLIIYANDDRLACYSNGHNMTFNDKTILTSANNLGDDILFEATSGITSVPSPSAVPSDQTFRVNFNTVFSTIPVFSGTLYYRPGANPRGGAATIKVKEVGTSYAIITIGLGDGGDSWQDVYNSYDRVGWVAMGYKQL